MSIDDTPAVPHTGRPGARTRLAGLSAALNGPWHRAALLAFAAIVLVHWAEHLVQAFQIYVLGWARPEALGLLGYAYPWLVSSEWMHYGYALLMMVGLIVLRHGFHDVSRRWWNAAMVVQIWHHAEHLLLLVQAATGAFLLGGSAPRSVLQLAFPRVELHLFYNAVVTIPMVVAMVLHMRATAATTAATTTATTTTATDAATCTCARGPRTAAVTPAAA